MHQTVQRAMSTELLKKTTDFENANLVPHLQENPFSTAVEAAHNITIYNFP